jgi:hypothetical protein
MPRKPAATRKRRDDPAVANEQATAVPATAVPATGVPATSDAPKVIGRPFLPGQSGNPGGKPKGIVEIQKRIAELTDGGDALILFALRVMFGQEDGMTSESSRAYAHRFLVERVWGRPKETVDVNVGQQLSPEQKAMLEALKLSPHDRRERIAVLKARAVTVIPAEVAAPSDDDGG